MGGAAGVHVELMASFLQENTIKSLLYGPYVWQNEGQSRLLKNMGVGGADAHRARSLNITFNHPHKFN